MKQRVKEYLKYKGVKTIEFSATIGVSNAYISSIKKSIQPDKLTRIQECYPDLNIEWLVTGRGNMLNTPQHMSVINNGTNSGTMGNNINMGSTCERCRNAESVACDGDCAHCAIPVVPSELISMPNTDIYKAVKQLDNVNRYPHTGQTPRPDLYYPIMSRAMEPYICLGDRLALLSFPLGEEAIEPGTPHTVDTLSKGFITRLIFEHPDGYLARAYDREQYPDFVIKKSDVIRVYRIIGLIRVRM